MQLRNAKIEFNRLTFEPELKIELVLRVDPLEENPDFQAECERAIGQQFVDILKNDVPRMVAKNRSAL